MHAFNVGDGFHGRETEVTTANKDWSGPSIDKVQMTVAVARGRSSLS